MVTFRAIRRPSRSGRTRLLAALFLVGCTTILGTRPLISQQVVTEPSGPHSPGAREPATSIWPTVTGRGLRTMDGDRLQVADLEGRWVLLDFWATWCAPCIAELPTLRSIAERYPPERLLLLGVSMNRSSRATVRAWLQRQRATWPQMHDGRGFDGPAAQALGVETLPRTLLVDPDGRIVAVDLRGNELLATIEALVENR